MPTYCHLSCLIATWPPPRCVSVSCYNQYVTCRGFVTGSALPRLLSSHLPNHPLHSIHTGLWGPFWDVPGMVLPLRSRHLAVSEDIVSLENPFIVALSIKASVCPATVHLMTLLCLFKNTGLYLNMFACLVAASFPVPDCASFKEDQSWRAYSLYP